MAPTPRLLAAAALSTAVACVVSGCAAAPSATLAPRDHSPARGTSSTSAATSAAERPVAPAASRSTRVAVRPASIVPAVVAPAGRYALGDSVMLGSRSRLEARGFRVSASVSRQFSAAPALLRARIAAGWLPRNVVVHLGTNGTIRLADCKAVVVIAGPARRVFLVTDRVPRTWMAPNNRVLRSCDAAFAAGRVVLVDWATYSAGHRTWFATDGFHPSTTGRFYYTMLIDTAVDKVGLR